MFSIQEDTSIESLEPLHSDMGVNTTVEPPKPSVGLQFRAVMYYPDALGRLKKEYIGEQEASYEAAKVHLDAFIADYPVIEIPDQTKTNFLLLVQAVE